MPKLNRLIDSIQFDTQNILKSLQIFSREGYRPSLTEAGHHFYESAKATLNSFRQLEKLSFELGSGKEARLIISIDPIVPIERLTALTETLHNEEHKPHIHIKSGVLLDNANDVINKLSDLGIGYLPQLDYHQLESVRLIASFAPFFRNGGQMAYFCPSKHK